ncbi:Ig-like domain-containing protein [Pelolinea submarina]|uniref:Ig-like domain-containing protein n=1 Tax=Pelolinea submarina TaxID=913107 RepID=UPI001319DD2A|nr:Ig-like domain-containing protein [Pelolinea submarina]
MSIFARLFSFTVPVYADGGLAFSGWGDEIADLSQYQNNTNAQIDSGLISALDTADSYSIEYLVDVSSITDAIADGEAQLAYAFNCEVSDEGEGANDSGQLTVSFTGAAAADQNHNCSFETQGNFSNSLTIPDDTTAIQFTFTGTLEGGTNTVTFGNVSMIVTDELAPRLDALSTPAAGGGATISVNAIESGSGLSGTYYAAGDRAADYFPAGGTEIEILYGSGSFDLSSGGTYTIYAADYSGNESLKTLQVNTYPQISGLSDQSIDEDATASFSFNITDAESAAGDLTISVISSDESILANGSIGLTNTDGLVAVSAAPKADANGSLTITFYVSDPQGLQQTQTINFSVNAVNDEPTANADAVSTDEDTPITINVLANDTNPDHGTLTVSLLSEPESGSALVNPDGTITYTPADNASGIVTFTYQILDSAGGDTDSAEVTVTVVSVDDMPFAMDDSGELAEDGSLTLNVLENDSDVEGDAFFISAVSDPPNGSAVISAGLDQITYSPDANYFGSDSFTYTIQETMDATKTATATVTLTINGENDAPVPSYNASVSTDEDTQLTESFTATDVDGDELTITVKDGNGPSHGSLLLGDGSYIYQPVDNYNGTDSFIITVSDGTAEVDCEITVTVNEVNDAPVPSYSASVSTDEDTPLSENLTATDIDLDELSYTVKEGNSPLHGTLELIEGGYTYTPAENYNGPDSFTITVGDGTNDVDCAISVTVNSVNDAPAASYSALVSTDEDTPLNETISATDADGDTVTFSVKDGNSPLHGTLELIEGGYTYSPNENYFGTDSFTITVSDGTAEVDCEITVTVNAVNDAPVPSYNASVSTDEDTALTEALTATDIDLDKLNYLVKDGNAPLHGTLELIEGGYTYSPNENYFGTDSFTITVSDGTDEVDCAISVTVNSINDAPVPSYTADVSMDEDTPLTEVLTATDVELDELTFSIKTNGSNGSVVLIEGGYTYSPNADFNGTDTFTIIVSDGSNEVDCDIAVTVNAVNDAPVPSYTASVSTDEDTPLTENLTATDVDLDELTFTIKDGSGPAHGSLELIEGGYIYSPDENYNGPDSFTIVVGDGTTTVDCDITVTVNAVNDKPVPSYSAAVSTDEDTLLTESLTATDVDLDELSYTVKAGSGPAHGTLTLIEGGYTYDPADDYNGSDSFTIVVDDGTDTVDCDITVTVNAVNDAPVPSYSAEVNTDEDTPLTESLTATDVDLDDLSYTVKSGNGPANGTLELIEGGYTYSPNENYNGADSFTTTVGDGTAEVDCAITVTVAAVNDDPVAVDDSAITNEDTPVTIYVLTNDSDVDSPEGDTFSPTAILSGPANGSAEIIGNTIVYSPDTNYYGLDEFTYQITDSGGLTASATVSIKINSVNDYPLPDGLEEEYTIDEDSSITITFNLTDVETPTETLTMQVVSGNTSLVPQTRITITGLEDTNPAVSIKLVPLSNQNGDATFTLRASDGFQTAVYTFTLHVTAVNDAPTARNDSISFTEDTPTVITVSSQLLNNDTDVDNLQSELSYVEIVTTTVDGTLVDNGDGTLTYTPAENYDSTDSFVYRIKDPDGATATATVTLTAAAVNDPPIISEIDDQTIEEDDTLTVNFTVQDFDLETEAEMNTLMITTDSTNPEILDANNMRVTGSGENRTFTAAPLADKNGTVTVTVTVSDGIAEDSTVFVVTVNPVPDAPTAVDDFFYVQETGTFAIDPLSNDWDADGDTSLTANIVSAPDFGTLEANGTAFTYSPNEDFDGEDSFTYTVTDSTGLISETATVTLSADPANHPPVITLIENQVIFEDEGGSVTFSVTDVDGNLSDVRAASSNTTVFPEGSLVLSNSGSDYTLTFTPAPNATCKSVLTITAEDSRGNQSTRTFTVRVVPINDLPTAVDDAVVTNEDQSVTFNVLSNDSDIETATANLVLRKVLSTPSHGRLSSLGSGQFRYTPYDDYNGSDSFTYEMIDTDGGVDSATVTITINSVNDAPEAYDNNLSTIVAPGGTLDNINVIGNDTDPDLPYDVNEEIHVTGIVSQPSCGTAYVNGDGSLKYEAFNIGGDCSEAWITFTYQIEDHYGATDTATVSIAVDTEEVNLSPRTYSIWRSIQEDAATITIDLSNYSFDPDGDSLSYLIDLVVTPYTNLGTAFINGSNIYYTPDANKNGSYSQENFTYSVTDGTSTVYATIYIEILAVNDAPTISMQTDSIVEIPDQEIDEDSTVSLQFYIDDVDIQDTGTTFGLDDLGMSVYSDDAELVPPESISYTRDNDTGLVTLEITPAEEEFGTANITVLVTDGIVYTSDTFLLTVNEVNDPPVAADHWVTTNEEEPIHVDVVDYLANVDGDTITISQGIIAPAHGTLSFDQANGDAIYTPALDYYGSDTFDFVLTDSGGLTDSGTVYVTILNVNDPPDITNLSAILETAEDTDISTTFTVSDIDTDLADITLSGVASDLDLIASYEFTKSTDGSGSVDLTIHPAQNKSGTATVEITASDGDKSDTESLTLKVYAVNDPPVVVNDNATTDEDTSVTINVIANDTDVEDPDTLYVVSTTSPKLLLDGTAGHGTVVNNNDGTLTYKPGANRNDDIFFTYEVSDSGNLRGTGTVTITINAVDDAPTVVGDNRTIEEDNPVTIAVLINDTDIEGDDFSIYSYTNPSHGSVSLDVDTQSFTYSPALNYYGTDTFTYTVAEDLNLEKTATATVRITITAEDDYPIVSTDEPWIMYEDTPGTFDVVISDAETASANLLITFTSLDTTLIKSYNVVLQGSGTSRTVKLTPEAQMNGSLQLQVDVNDGALTTTEYIDIIIMPVNDPPIAQDYTATVTEDGSVNGMVVVKSDIDLLHEGDSHTYALGTDGAHGTAVVQSDGNWTYTPDANYNGSDSFTVIITDEGGATATSTVSVTVDKENDVPEVTSENKNKLDEDTSVTDTIVVYDPDTADGTDPDSIIIQVTTPPAHGEVDLDGLTGEYTYTPDANYNGSDSFTVKVTDEHDTFTSKTVLITVDPVNDAPVAVDDGVDPLIVINEEGSVTIYVLANDDDIDLTREGDELFIDSYSGVDNGSVEIAAGSKSLTFTPDADWNGTETFTYTVIDKHGAKDTANVTVTVNAVNDRPVISDVANQKIDEDTNTGALSFTVTDVDNEDGSLQVTAATSNSSVIPLSGIVLAGSGSSRSVTVTPAADYNTWNPVTSAHEPVTITLTVSDGTLTQTDTFTVTVDPVNDAPVAADDVAPTIKVDEDGTLVISVLANDTDVDIAHEGDSLTIQSFTGVDNGTVTIINSATQLRYVPDADFFGIEEFTYTVVDENNATDTATVKVTVNAVNDPPVISDIADQTIDEDSATDALEFTVTDVDNDDAALQVTAATGDGTVIPLSGIALGGSGSNRTVTVTPAADKNTWNALSSAHEPITITLTVSDGSLTDSTSFKVTILPKNDTPEPEDDSTSVDEDHEIDIDVLDNDYDVDISNESDDLTILSFDGVDNGTVTIISAGKLLHFKPDADWFGTEEFTYTVEDENHATATATVTVTVDPINDAPVISNVANQSINEDSATAALSFTVTDVDNDDAALQVTAATSEGATIPLSGISFGGSGSSRTVTITPLTDKNTWNDTASAHDPVTITLTVSDGSLTDTDTFTVTVLPLNDGPDAVDDTASLLEDGSKTIYVLSNDTDVDLSNEGDDLIITHVDGVDNATVTITHDGKDLLFVPDNDWNGEEVFTYTIEDEGGASDTAQVTVTVTAQNDAPVAVNDTTAVDEDGSVKILVLDNDTDEDIGRESDSLTIISTDDVDHGTVTIALDKKTLTFTPEADWSGVEEFTYTITDTHDAEASATVRVAVKAVVDDPIANDDSFSMAEDAGLTSLDVLHNDTDADLDYGDSLTINAIITDPAHGSISIDSVHQRVLYSPDANYNGSDSFTYQIKDTQDPAVTDNALVSLTITAVNDLPVVTSTNSHTIQEDNSASGKVTSTDVDNADSPDPDSQTYSIQTEPGHGTATLDTASGAYTYTPAENYNGGDSFVVLVSDEHGGTTTQTVTISITPVNDAPKANDDSFNTPEDTPVTDVVDASDPDVATNGDKLTFTVSQAPANGTLDLNADSGAFTYTPDINFNGLDAFSVLVTDKAGETAEADISVYVNYYENDPEANADYYTLDEDDGMVSFDVLDNDEDADLPYGDELHLVSITSGPAHGSAVINTTTHEIEYTLDANYNGTDSFTYQIKDNQDPAVYDSAVVTITVTPINDVPVITSSHTQSMDEDSRLTGFVTFEDPDLADVPESDSHLFYTNAAPLHGKIDLNQFTGEYLYTPAKNYNGTDSFTIRVTDAHNASDTQTITVTVNWVDDDPVANADSYRMSEGAGWKTLNVVDNDTDADLVYGDSLTITQILSDPAHGTVQINATTNTVKYKPKAGFHGTDSFVYEIRDNQEPLVTDSATVTMKVSVSSNDGTAGSYTDDYYYNSRSNGASGNKNGVSGAVLLYEDHQAVGSVSAANAESYMLDPNNPPQNGRVIINSVTGQYTYTPNPDYNGEESFTILAQTSGRVLAQEIELMILPVNDSPTAADLTLALTPNQSGNTFIHAEDVDVFTNDDQITYMVLYQPEHGSVEIDPLTGEINYEPEKGFIGEDSCTIRIQDEFGQFTDCLVKLMVEEESIGIDRDSREMPAAMPTALLLTALGIFLFILIPFFVNVKIRIMAMKPNGKYRKVVRYKTVVSGSGNEVSIDLGKEKTHDGQVNQSEIVLLRSFIWRFRNKTLVIKRQGAVIKTVKVEANDNGRMVIPL